jgi:hypothetical protein
MSTLSRTSVCFAVLGLLVAAPAALHADSYSYDIVTSGAAPMTVSGTFNGPTDQYNPAATDVTSITGSASSYNFVGVVDPGNTDTKTTSMYNDITFDNVIYPGSGPHADPNGLLLYLDSPAGTSLAHVYYTAANGYQVDVFDPNDPGANTPFSIVGNTFAVSRFSLVRVAAPPSAVPEPSTWLLLGTGLACAAGFMTRRRLHAGFAS